MSNVDLQKNPVEGFSAGLVDDNIYEVTFYIINQPLSAFLFCLLETIA